MVVRNKRHKDETLVQKTDGCPREREREEREREREREGGGREERERGSVFVRRRERKKIFSSECFSVSATFSSHHSENTRAG